MLRRHQNSIKNLNEEYKVENAEFLKVPSEAGFYEVCLCLGEYENAIVALESRLRQMVDAIETNKKYGIEPGEKILIRKEKLVSQISKTRDFQKGNSFPDKIIKENEYKTLNSYLKKLC